jgi:hypothetical protein
LILGDRETPPTLTIPDLGFQKYSADPKNNESVITYQLNALDANVHLLDYYYVIMNTKGNIFGKLVEFVGEPMLSLGTMNFTTIIPAGEKRPMAFFVDRVKAMDKVTDTFLLAMEFVYKSKLNKIQTPLRKVFIVDYPNHVIREANNSVFMQAALYLKKKGIWKRFYNL